MVLGRTVKGLDGVMLVYLSVPLHPPRGHCGRRCPRASATGIVSSPHAGSPCAGLRSCCCSGLFLGFRLLAWAQSGLLSGPNPSCLGPIRSVSGPNPGVPRNPRKTEAGASSGRRPDWAQAMFLYLGPIRRMPPSYCTDWGCLALSLVISVFGCSTHA